jgi:hypothetical protein
MTDRRRRAWPKRDDRPPGIKEYLRTGPDRTGPELTTLVIYG